MKIYFVIFVIVLNVIYDVNGALISTDKVLDPPQGTNPPQNDTSWKANETLADRLQRLRLRSKLITTTPKIETLSTQTVPETQNQVILNPSIDMMKAEKKHLILTERFRSKFQLFYFLAR